MSLQKRVEINNQKINVDGLTVYEYTYEVTKPNGDKTLLGASYYNDKKDKNDKELQNISIIETDNITKNTTGFTVENARCVL